MKKAIVWISLVFLMTAITAYAGDKRDVLIKKYFRNSTTYVIECKGYPKEGLTGKPAVETAREAALTNAQFIARDLFTEPVDPVKNGIAEKYTVHGDYVVIRYALKYPGLRGKLRKK